MLIYIMYIYRTIQRKMVNESDAHTGYIRGADRISDDVCKEFPLQLTWHHPCNLLKRYNKEYIEIMFI